MPISTYPIGLTKHVQQDPAATWAITHGNPGYPVVDVYVNVADTLQKVIPLEVVYIDEYNVEIRFSEPRAGFATVIV